MKKNYFISLLITLVTLNPFLLRAQETQTKSFDGASSQQSSQNIEVSLLNQSKDAITNKVDNILYPITAPYLREIITLYNKAVVNAKNPDMQLKTLKISKIFSNASQARQDMIKKVLEPKTLFTIFSTTDKKDQDFMKNFLTTVMSKINNKKNYDTLFRNINNDVDSISDNSYVNANNTIISKYLIQKFGFKSPQIFSLNQSTIEAIGKTALEQFKIDESFKKAVILALKKNIAKKGRITEEEAQKSALSNLYFITTKNIFNYIAPAISDAMPTLIQDPAVQAQVNQLSLSKKSLHSIPSLSLEEINHLNETLNKGKSFYFALDLDMPHSKTIKGKPFLMDTSSPTYSLLKNALNSKTSFQNNGYLLIFLQNHIKIHATEKSIHLEFKLEKQPGSGNFNDLNQNESDDAIDKMKSDAENDLKGSPAPAPQAPIANNKPRLPQDKNFETPPAPNKEAWDEDKQRKLNFDKYNRLLGKPYKGGDKKFEDF